MEDNFKIRSSLGCLIWHPRVLTRSWNKEQESWCIQFWEIDIFRQTKTEGGKVY